MPELMKASNQWASRPADERFVSFMEMNEHFKTVRDQSSAHVIPSRRLFAKPDADHKGLRIAGPEGREYSPTHFSFGQVASRADAPAGYLRSLPADIAADCINYGLQFRREIEDVGVLVQHNGDAVLRAATGPRYGRIWNTEIVGALIERFGDGVTGDWRVPGEFGKAVEVNKRNTTLYASDRDMFVFLADEVNRIEIANRRGGQSGSLARGFFVWNSEVGDKSFGIGTFLFDYVCCNRIVWGAEDYKEIRVRHSVSAPDKFFDEIHPALVSYANGSASTIESAIKAAQDRKMTDGLDDFLAQRFSKSRVEPMKKAFEIEEGRPIETLWDVTTAATAYAKSVKWQDNRVEIERQAGAVLKLAA